MPVDQLEKPFAERDLEDLRRFLASEPELQFVAHIVDKVRHAALEVFSGDVGRAWDLLKSFRRSKARKRRAEADGLPKPPRGYSREARAELKAWIEELRRRSGVTFALAWRLPEDARPSLAHSADMTREAALCQFADILDYYSQWAARDRPKRQPALGRLRGGQANDVSNGSAAAFHPRSRRSPCPGHGRPSTIPILSTPSNGANK